MTNTVITQLIALPISIGAALATSLTAAGSFAESTARPNVIVCMVDDMGIYMPAALLVRVPCPLTGWKPQEATFGVRW